MQSPSILHSSGTRYHTNKCALSNSTDSKSQYKCENSHNFLLIFHNRTPIQESQLMAQKEMSSHQLPLPGMGWDYNVSKHVALQVAG